MPSLTKFAPGAIERSYTVPKDPTALEKWMQGLGSKFVIIWFYDRRSGEFVDERHVDDDETLLETIRQSFDRMGWRHAMWDHGDGWTTLNHRTGEAKTWPNREAAEMFVIHNG